MRETLLKAVEDARQLHLDFVGRLTDEEKATTGTFEQWSGKDVLGHVLFWIENLNIHIQQAMHGTPLTDYDDYNAHNAEDYPRKKTLSWPEMMDLLNTTFDTLARLLTDFPINEADLTREEWEKWTGGRTLQNAVLGSALVHPLDHFVHFLLNHDHVSDMEMMVQKASDMLVSYERVQANVGYNLACYYAKKNQPEKALPLLREAFIKNGRLKEWSQQDTDIDNLRSLPEYQALLTPETEA
jgi:hypothetical protein